MYFLDRIWRHVGAVPVYTDGSKSENGVSWVVEFSLFEARGSLPKSVLIFTRESLAIFKDVCNVFECGRPARQFLVYSDCSGTVKVLRVLISLHPLVCAIQDGLVQFARVCVDHLLLGVQSRRSGWE